MQKNKWCCNLIQLCFSLSTCRITSDSSGTAVCTLQTEKRFAVYMCSAQPFPFPTIYLLDWVVIKRRTKPKGPYILDVTPDIRTQ